MRRAREMVSRLNKTLAFVRDSIVFSFSVVVIGSTWGQWASVPFLYILDGFGAIFIALSVVDVALLVKNVRRRAFYFGNAIYQLFPSFMLASVLLSFGLVLMTLNLMVLFTLGQKPPPAVSPTPASEIA